MGWLKPALHAWGGPALGRGGSRGGRGHERGANRWSARLDPLDLPLDLPSPFSIFNLKRARRRTPWMGLKTPVSILTLLLLLLTARDRHPPIPTPD